MKLFFQKSIKYLSKNWFGKKMLKAQSWVTMMLIIFLSNDALAQQGFHFEFTQRQHNLHVSLDAFIHFIENIEQTYPEQEQRNLSLMITRFRKLYYHSRGFDKYLIKGTLEVKPPQLRQMSLCPAEVLNTPQQAIDMGHVLCGIDAHYHQHKVTSPTILGVNILSLEISSNINAVTWIGDLGSLVAEIYTKQKRLRRQLTDVEMQMAVDNLSGAADNIGNIDGVILGNIFATASERSVATLFHHFYRLDTMALKDRVLLFAKRVGLQWDGREFRNKTSLQKLYADQVNDAAAMYFAESIYQKKGKQIIRYLPRIIRISHTKIAYRIVARFFDDLEQAISASPTQ